MNHEVFQQALPVVTTLRRAGYQAYFVGGAVRNMLLQLPVNDIDITTDALPDEVEALFDKTVPIGKEHGTILVLLEGSYEVTTFREDGEYKDHRRPDEVHFVKELRDDLIRRDFTINALALNESMEVVDKVGGLADIKQRLIRAVGNAEERFEEDALRMIRACRFQSVLDFDIEQATYRAMKTHAPSIQWVAVERTMKEMTKLIEGAAPYKGLQSLVDSAIIRYIPVFNEVMLPYPKRSVTVQSYIGYLLYKKPLESLSELKLSRKDIQLVKNFVHIYTLLRQQYSEDDIKMIAYRYGSQLLIDAVLMLNSIDIPVSISAEDIVHIANTLPIKARHEMEMDGRKAMTYLNRAAGPWLRDLLNDIEQQIVTGKLSNSETEIFRWIEDNVKI